MSDVDVGEGWRRLKPGEVIRQGDQVQSGADWILTSRAGWTLKEKDRHYRRRVADEARPATLRPRTPGEAAAYAEGMAASVVADLMRERDAAREECKRQSAANHTLNDVATALESRVSELKKELKLAKEANAGGFSNQPAASGAGKSAECGNQEPVKYAVIVGGEMRNTVYDNFSEARYRASEIACRGTPHFVGVVALYRETPRPRVKAPVCPIVRDGNASQCQGSGWDMAAEAFKRAMRDAGVEVDG